MGLTHVDNSQERKMPEEKTFDEMTPEEQQKYLNIPPEGKAPYPDPKPEPEAPKNKMPLDDEDDKKSKSHTIGGKK